MGRGAEHGLTRPHMTSFAAPFRGAVRRLSGHEYASRRQLMTMRLSARRLWALGGLAAVGLAVGLLVTGSPVGAQQPRQGGELIFPVPSEPPSYDGHREETFGLIHPLAPF